MNNLLNNPFLAQLMTSSNPQQMVMNMMKSNSGNPIINNAMQMMNNGDTKGLEQLARNLGRNQGINVDQMYQNIFNLFRK